jgi:hypothetical protein
MYDLLTRTKFTLSKLYTNLYDTNTLKSQYEKSRPHYYINSLI